MFRGLDGFLEVWALLDRDGLRPEPIGSLSGHGECYLLSVFGDASNGNFLENSVERHAEYTSCV